MADQRTWERLERRWKMDEDLWGTETGLVSDYEGKCVDAWFGVNAAYNSQTTLLFLKMTTDVPEHPEVTEQYSCGPDWQSIDGGKTVIHPSKKKFNSNTQAGRLVDKVIKLAVAEFRERGFPPTDARAWLGTKWYMEAETKEGKLQDGTEYKSSRNFPTKFLGVDGNVVMGGGPEGGREGSVGASGRSGPDPALMTKMGVLAKTLTHTDWIDKVMELDGVVTDEDLVVALTDEDGLYKQLREG